MRILSFVLKSDVVAAILCHLQSKRPDLRALPEHALARVERAPP